MQEAWAVEQMEVAREIVMFFAVAARVASDGVREACCESGRREELVEGLVEERRLGDADWLEVELTPRPLAARRAKKESKAQDQCLNVASYISISPAALKTFQVSIMRGRVLPRAGKTKKTLW